MQKQYERPRRGKYSRLEFEMHQMTRSRQQNNSDNETSGDILDKYLSELWPNIDEDFNGIDNFESRVFETARRVISRYEIVAKTENLKLPVSADDRESVALFGILIVWFLCNGFKAITQPTNKENRCGVADFSRCKNLRREIPAVIPADFIAR